MKDPGLSFLKFKHILELAKQQDLEAIEFLLEFMQSYFEDDVPLRILLQCSEIILNDMGNNLRDIASNN